MSSKTWIKGEGEEELLPIKGMASWRRKSVCIRSSWVLCFPCSSGEGTLPAGGWRRVEKVVYRALEPFHQYISHLSWYERHVYITIQTNFYCVWWMLGEMKKDKPVQWTASHSQTPCMHPTRSTPWSYGDPLQSGHAQKLIGPSPGQQVNPCLQ